jgi:hypothetical protein
MTAEELIEMASPEKIAEVKALLGLDEQEQQEQPKAEKIKCKVCGFAKKPRKSLVETGVCKVCTVAIEDGDGEVEVVGRMGKRGRNSVSVMIDGRRWKVKRLSPKHSERVAGKYASKGRGYARKPKAHVTDIVSPKGLPTDSRIGADRDQRDHEQMSMGL